MQRTKSKALLKHLQPKHVNWVTIPTSKYSWHCRKWLETFSNAICVWEPNRKWLGTFTNTDHWELPKKRENMEKYCSPKWLTQQLPTLFSNSELPLKIIFHPWKFGDSNWKPSFSAAFQGGASWLPPFLSFGKVVAESAVVLSCGALAALRDPNRIQKVDKNSGNRGTVL